MSEMFRMAVPNKGALAEPATQMLSDAGYRCRRRGRELVLVDESEGIEFFFLRPRDIAVYVARGTVDAGITGLDLLQDSGIPAEVVRKLGFGAAKLRFAAPHGTATNVRDLAGLRVATSFDTVTRKYLAKNGVAADIVHLEGAVESAIRLGVADAIADVVETGTTLRAAGLEVFGQPILSSEAVLITGQGRTWHETLARMERRLEGVGVARGYVLVDYNIQADCLDAAIAVTPGIESPTVSHLHNTDWLAVRAMVKRSEANMVLDRLYDEGARGILVTEIVACRL